LQGLAGEVLHCLPRTATIGGTYSFHTADYVEFVRQKSLSGEGFLDGGDTPAFRGIFDAASSVVGATLVAVESLMSGACRRAFVPIAGLHHAARESSRRLSAFSMIVGWRWNACGRVMTSSEIAYVDIDAHHGDGMFYAFENDPDLLFADIHEDGRELYPAPAPLRKPAGGAAAGTKLNLPLPGGAGDAEFFAAWSQVEAYLERFPSEFILFQCGADSLAGDPITHLRFSEAAHAHAAGRLCAIADAQGHGRVLGMAVAATIGEMWRGRGPAWCARFSAKGSHGAATERSATIGGYFSEIR